MFKKLIKLFSGKTRVVGNGFGAGRSNSVYAPDSSENPEPQEHISNQPDKKFVSRLVNKRTIQGREHRSSNPYSVREVENMNIKYLLEDIKQENTLTPKTIELLEFISKKVIK
ncbi:hypothetical protein [Pseudoalteromonas sp. JB197]|uniref:hypothetical protein n=1 Tax=Pseudoalteromonas sp. JB197 TaxID=1434839 RepID=UPI00097F0C10|nr:hypothetical protein [Pseudoalteromonas sp. JB197]PCC12908.1 hypothetical protein CIK86_06240 [Pseudoalteromonas sp. JB197]SJN25411.1 hypothetical protein CZ797_04225 [Pseudoalteromonas sp. JB197]